MKYFYIILIINLLQSCNILSKKETVICGYAIEKKPLERIGVVSELQFLFKNRYKDFDKKTLVEVFFRTTDPAYEKSEDRIIVFAFDSSKSIILVIDGNYNLLQVGKDFPKKPLGELKALCVATEQKYFLRDCEIEGGREESIRIFKNNIFSYYFFSRGYTINTMDDSKKVPINTGVLVKKLVKLAKKTKPIN